MAKEATLIFPDQLFENHPAVSLNRAVYIVEEFLFFKVQNFHQQRLLLLRAAMRAYLEKLKDKQFNITYLASDCLNSRGQLFKKLAEAEIDTIHLCDFADEWLRNDIKTAEKNLRLKFVFYDSPAFICQNQHMIDYFQNKKNFRCKVFTSISVKICKF